jgi:hypothetical protein
MAGSAVRAEETDTSDYYFHAIALTHGPTDHLYRVYLDRVKDAEGVIWRRTA